MSRSGTNTSEETALDLARSCIKAAAEKGETELENLKILIQESGAFPVILVKALHEEIDGERRRLSQEKLIPELTKYLMGDHSSVASVYRHALKIVPSWENPKAIDDGTYARIVAEMENKQRFLRNEELKRLAEFEAQKFAWRGGDITNKTPWK